ncbi:MAG: glycerate kinase [Thermoleophilia bacterium]|nr:glycerate kinase [Thermoleophilia bacterium]
MSCAGRGRLEQVRGGVGGADVKGGDVTGADARGTDVKSKTFLVEAFRHALREVAPESVLPGTLPAPPKGRTVVVGAGKAAASMARFVEQIWTTELSGLVVVPHGYALPCGRIRVLEAAHPVPDDAGAAAAREILGLVRGLSDEDLVLALFSGGGSALLPLPAGEVTMADKRSLTSRLLRAGAAIGEINCVRKHLSVIKGGRLARACAPAALANILISDVAGDDPSAIASGPGVPDPCSLADARRVIEKYGLDASAPVLRHLSSPENETPKPGDPCFARMGYRIVASSQTFLEAAARFFERRGLRPVILSDSVQGESRDVALVHAAVARQIARHGQPVPAPCVLLSGGETTVTVRGPGRGGRNTEFLLALVLALGEDVRYAALACDTDGVDGMAGAVAAASEGGFGPAAAIGARPVAGAVAGSDTLARAAAAGLDPGRLLHDNDAHTFFEALGDTVVTGPTHNNLNDFRALPVHRQPSVS